MTYNIDEHGPQTLRSCEPIPSTQPATTQPSTGAVVYCLSTYRQTRSISSALRNPR